MSSGTHPGVVIVPASAIDEGLAEEWELARLRSPYPRGEERLDWLQREAEARLDRSLSLAVLRDGDGCFRGGLALLDEPAEQRWRVRLPGQTRTVARFGLRRTSVVTEAVVGDDDTHTARLLMDAVLDRRVGADVVVVPLARVGSGLDHVLGTARRANARGWLPMPVPRIETRFQIRLPDAFDDYLAQQFNSRMRYNLGWDRRKLLARPSTLTLVSEPEQVGPFVAAAAEVWAASWHGQHAAPLTERALGDDLRWWAGRGGLRAHLLTDPEGPLAFALCRLVDGTLWIDKMAYRADRPKKGPGKVTMAHAIAEAHREGARLVDIKYGDYPYKREWCNARLELRGRTFVRAGAGPVVAVGGPALYGRSRSATIALLGRLGVADRVRLAANRRLGR